MDSYGGQFSNQDERDGASSRVEDAGAGSPPAVIGTDERRMQVRAYNFWASLLDNRNFPDIAALHPHDLQDFGPYSVLLDFTAGIDNPGIAYLGTKLADECGADGAMHRLNDIPSRSLLSRITDHYMQILANQAPIGFEAEFVNQRGITILYRGILLPFSRDDAAIDHIYGVINWKELADQSTTDILMRQVDEAVEARPVLLREAVPMNEWADGPADPGFGRVDFAPADFAPADFGDSPLELPLAEFGLPGYDFGEAAVPGQDTVLSLADWLALAREEAHIASGCEDRSRLALYHAVGRAYDFALAAMEAPEDFAELAEDAGLKVQERAPLIPLVKLVFGADYDKTRLTEFATVIAHGQRLGLASGTLGARLAETPGGLKALVSEERRLRRAESGKDGSPRDSREQRVARLRRLQPRSLESARADGEFAVLVVRRMDDGSIALLGEVEDDPALLDRAARHLLN